MAAPTEDGNETKPAHANTETSVAKKKSKKTKKAFVPLPILEQAQNKLPWHIAFSQKLGRHAVARRDIQAGERVLAEEAVIAVPAPLHQDSTCHTCLGALPPNTEHQHADQPIVDVTSGGYKRYCSQQCHDNDTYAAVTAPVHAVIPQLAENTACDPTLLHVMLELDARCQQAVTNAKESTTEATADSNAQALSNLTLANPSQKAAASSSKAASDGDHNATAATSASHINREASAAAAATSSDQSGPAAPPASTEEGYSATTAAAAATANGHQTDSAAHQHEDSALVVHSAIEDVQALLGPWDRNEHSWREAIAAGCQALQDAVAKSGSYEPGSLQQLQFFAACVNGNAHATGHQAGTNSTTALGMYPVLSMFNHSCNPNLAQSSIGTVQHVHATRAVKKGQQLCVHYTELFEPRRVRQQALLQEKFFSCACDRCSVPIEQSPDRFLEGIQCSKGHCREVVLSDKSAGSSDEIFTCVGCRRTTPGRAVDGTGPRDIEQQATRLWNYALQTLQQQGNDAAKPLFQQLQDQYQGPGKLHPLHVRIMDTHMPLVNSCRRTGNIQDAVKNLTQLINAMEYHHPSPFLETMNLYQHLAELYIDLATSAQPNKKLVARAQKLARDAHRRYVSLRNICQGQDPAVSKSDAAFLHDLAKATVFA